MESNSASALLVLAGTLLGGFISMALQWQRNRHEFARFELEHKAEYAAEETARRLLEHRGYTDRSFKAIQYSLGGFEADELRRLLVRAGAVRVRRPDGGEWWYLIGREPERIARLEARRQAQDEEQAG